MESAPFLIIGGTRGIGLALVKRLISNGHQVITVSRGTDAPPGVAEHWTCDLIKEGLFMDRMPAALAGMVYCPGSIELKPLRLIKPDDVRAAFELNALCAFTSIQACVDRLKQVPGSGIVLFSTVAVQRGMAFHAGVAMAKGAVEGLTRSLAAELAPNVRVNCIAPSLTRTPLAEKLLSTPEREAASAERHPLKRVGEASEVAAMAAFLLSDAARWITGQVIGVDGGMSAI